MSECDTVREQTFHGLKFQKINKINAEIQNSVTERTSLQAGVTRDVENVSYTLLIVCWQEIRHFLRQKGASTFYCVGIC